MNIRHATLHDVIGRPAQSGAFTIVPAHVKLDGTSFSPSFPLNELPQDRIPPALRVAVEQHFDASWVRAEQFQTRWMTPGEKLVTVRWDGPQGCVAYSTRAIEVESNEPFDPALVSLQQVAPVLGPPLGIHGPCHLGNTSPEAVAIEITAICDGTNWNALLTGVIGQYSRQVALPPGTSDVTGPNGNTTEANYCDQVADLFGLEFCSTWWMIGAVNAHEDVHQSHLIPTLQNYAPEIESLVEILQVPDQPGMTTADAVLQMRNLPGFAFVETEAQTQWYTDAWYAAGQDHFGPTQAAEILVLVGMIETICTHASESGWSPCASCPP